MLFTDGLQCFYSNSSIYKDQQKDIFFLISLKSNKKISINILDICKKKLNAIFYVRTRRKLFFTNKVGFFPKSRVYLPTNNSFNLFYCNLHRKKIFTSYSLVTAFLHNSFYFPNT